MTILKTGSRLKSQIDDTQVIVVRAPATDLDLTCGGHAMVDIAAEAAPGLDAKADLSGGSALGKRFTIEGDDTLELLVTKAGIGTLAIGTEPLVLKDAKPLPSSD